MTLNVFLAPFSEKFKKLRFNLCKDRINKHKCELWLYHSQHGEVRTLQLWILDVESIIEYLGIFQAGQLIMGPGTEIMERDLQSHKNVVCFLARLRHDFDILAFIDVNMIS